MAENKYNSGVARVVLPVATASGDIHQIAVPPDLPLPDFHDALLDAGYHLGGDQQPSPLGALEMQPKFKEQVARAWESIGNGTHESESDFLVNDDGTMSKIHEEPDNAKLNGHISVKAPAGTFAVVHTHNLHLSPKPSTGDIESAKKWGHPIYVASRDGLYVIDPAGNVTHVYNSIDDLTKKAKKK